MAKDFTQMTDAELGKCFRSRYDRLCSAHDMGLDDGTHPAERWHADTEILKAHRAATASDEGGLGNVEIQNKAKSGAQDSAAVGAEDHAIRRSGSADVEGQLALAAAKRSNPARIRAMSLAIKGLDRIK